MDYQEKLLFAYENGMITLKELATSLENLSYYQCCNLMVWIGGL